MTNKVNTGKTVEAKLVKASFTTRQEVWFGRKDGIGFNKLATRDTLGRFHGATNFKGTRR